MSMQQSKLVWITVSRGADRSAYHTDPDCQYIREGTARRVEKRLLHDDMTVCKRCADEYENGEARFRECPLCGEELSNDLPAHLRAGCSDAG